ncbi:MAG: translation initiation factor IF-2 [Thermoproteales archaeon]|nr:translation initiation factor IF-2 [Thermoproteales archaeon]
MDEYIRSPIVVVLGHVDVGKTTLLDKIRGTAVTKREPGTMTQHIGASFLPWKALELLCGPLASSLRTDIKIPGILVIDTPGHEAFANLRTRGGSIADIAILVIDINKGFENQTYEALEILKSRKTPFIVAANKIDRIPGWNSQNNYPFIQNLKNQDPETIARFEERLAVLIRQFNREGFRADRYDRIRDFSKIVAIVPVSAKTGEGVPDLLLVLAGIAQRFLLKRLKTREGPGKAVILEVKEEIGLGTTAAIILYQGVIKKGDLIVLGGMDGPITTRIKTILMPKPLDEMRSPEDRFIQIDKVRAAAGVLLVAHGLDLAIAGAPVKVVEDKEKLDDILKEVEEEIESLKIARDQAGVVVKADTLGTLEALVNYLKRENIPIRFADVGPVVRRDVIEASLSKNINRFYAVILAFNVKVNQEAEEEAKAYNIKIFRGNIIYRLVEDFLEWYRTETEKEKKITLEKLVLPASIQILPGYVFRRSNPAIVGIKVLVGKLRRGTPLMTQEGLNIGEIMQIQKHGASIDIAETGDEVAVSIRGKVTVGRQIKEGDILFSDIPLDNIDILMDKFVEDLSEEEIKLLRKIRKIKIAKTRKKLL